MDDDIMHLMRLANEGDVEAAKRLVGAMETSGASGGEAVYPIRVRFYDPLGGPRLVVGPCAAVRLVGGRILVEADPPVAGASPFALAEPFGWGWALTDVVDEPYRQPAEDLGWHAIHFSRTSVRGDENEVEVDLNSNASPVLRHMDELDVRGLLAVAAGDNNLSAAKGIVRLLEDSQLRRSTDEIWVRLATDDESRDVVVFGPFLSVHLDEDGELVVLPAQGWPDDEALPSLASDPGHAEWTLGKLAGDPIGGRMKWPIFEVSAAPPKLGEVHKALDFAARTTPKLPTGAADRENQDRDMASDSRIMFDLFERLDDLGADSNE